MPAIHPLRDRVAALLAGADIHPDGGGECDPAIHDQRFYSRVLAQGSLGLGETWMDGWWDVASLDGMLARLLAAQLDERVHGLASLADNLRARLLNLQAERRSREVGRRHYDLGNDLYAAMLGKRLIYSCGYWRDAQDLDAAQEAKLDLVCRKLRLRPGQRLLDIGCGWGALLCWAARHYGVQAHGVTLSRNQYEYARCRIAEDGLEGRVTVALQDYRDIVGAAQFDKIASVGMFEHVGLKNLPVYFGTAQRLLRDGGLFLNHGITHDREGWPDSVNTRFINRYVFPDGELDTVSNVQRAMERAGFEIWDVEGLRPHYALTLRHWIERLETRRPAALQHVTEEVFRIWRLYMAACARAFEDGSVGVSQILVSKRAKGPPPVPLTRRDVYRAR